ncbi:MAG: indole-3-glycerol phosphate synthase [Planctomycetes bacterium SM23_32]|nr:MAG: indole-3-glycerol phosphate synthase [Planctomycetes bacterium SM23_32]
MKDLPDILKRICHAKRREAEALRAGDVAALRRRAADREPARGFRSALASAPDVALIAEVKRASPSAGVLRADFDPVEIARAYERGGATCISVLTDHEFFQGEASHLTAIRRAAALPLLRKDFILDALQVVEARAIGADAYLLIVAALEREQLEDLLAAGAELGMDALVEVHREPELDAALSAGAGLVGINNRDLRTFEVSLEVTERLAPRVPDDVLLVAESGIRTRADVERLAGCGVKAVLVGEALMRAEDVEAAARALAAGA